MALVVPAEGENKLLAFLLGKSTTTGFLLKLYTTDVALGGPTTLANMTEMNTHGYAPIPLAPTDWVVSQNASGKAEAAQPTKTWTFDGTGGNTAVYGYYVTDAGGTVLLWAESFGATTGKAIQYVGDQIVITPKFTLSSEA